MELDQPDAVPVGGAVHGVPTAQSSTTGLIAAALTGLAPARGKRLVEVGAYTGYLAALAADLTGRQVTGAEIDPGLVRAVSPRPVWTCGCRCGTGCGASRAGGR
ncbi:hypothetical protein [Kitasatospora sp. NPDC088783]|uniref:hypothetical protein n=1 Tax=Kitasatospora sp. NPDC088783 TaxID=3364077 RepID=UPI0038114F8A